MTFSTVVVAKAHLAPQPSVSQELALLLPAELALAK